MATLTVANSVFTLSCPDLDIAPVQIQGFATDDAFDTTAVKPVETIIGVDGRMSKGFVAFTVPFKFMLQADSPSILIMDAIQEAQEIKQEAFTLYASIVAPGLGKLWTFSNGGLTGYKKTPQAKKLMGPLDYEITWEKVISAVA